MPKDHISEGVAYLALLSLKVLTISGESQCKVPKKVLLFESYLVNYAAHPKSASTILASWSNSILSLLISLWTMCRSCKNLSPFRVSKRMYLQTFSEYSISFLYTKSVIEPDMASIIIHMIPSWLKASWHFNICSELCICMIPTSITSLSISFWSNPPYLNLIIFITKSFLSDLRDTTQTSPCPPSPIFLFMS